MKKNNKEEQNNRRLTLKIESVIIQIELRFFVVTIDK